MICLSLSLQSISQIQVIKVKKETGQSEAPWHVTICGMYRGDVKVEDLYKNNQLKIAYNTIGLRILYFDVAMKSKGKLYLFSTSGDTLSLDIRSRLIQADKNSKIYIDDIKAVSKNKDTVFLNPITLRIIE